MYESHFGLTRRPFLSTPDPDCVARVDSVDNALAGLTLCVESGQGFGILSAPAGTGKTLLCRKLVNDLSDRYSAIFLANSHFPSRRSLLQAILYELGQPYMRMAEQELRLELQTAARNVRPEKKAVVLVIDEAHLLSEQLLEELRTAGNLDLDGTPLFHVILSGQMELEENLISPGLEALNQRIGCQVTLEPLTREESASYIGHRLHWSGANINDVFEPEAVRVICHAADGLPRCLNQLCDHSLLLSYVADEGPVSEATVREALEDLKQLPLHWNEPAPATTPQEPLNSDVADCESLECDDTTGATVVELGAAPVEHEVPSVESNPDVLNEITAVDYSEGENIIEIGDSSSVEVGAPLVSSIEEPATEESTAAVFEIGAADVAEYADPEPQTLEMEASLVDDTAVSADDVPPPAETAEIPLFSMHRQSIADDGRGFEEELVVDRYAMLDAGLSVAEQVALSSLGIRGDVAHPEPVVHDVPQIGEAEPSPTQAETVEFGHDDNTIYTPVQLIDAIEPLVSEVLDDPTADEMESAGRISETVVSTPSSVEDVDWAGLTINGGERSDDRVEETVPPAPVDAGEYDIVQPEVDEPSAVASGESDVSESAAGGKPQGRYAHLFSKLRRQQRRSA